MNGHTNTRLLTLDNRCFASFGFRDGLEEFVENAICDEFHCRPEVIQWDEDEDGIEWFRINNVVTGRLQQKWLVP